MEVECKKVEAKKGLNVEFDHEKGEIRVFGVRAMFTNLIPACKRIDKMFGTGGEVIVHSMTFEQGFQLFEEMMRNSPDKTNEELLKEIINVQPLAGWGKVSLKIVNHNPPRAEVTVKNPPVKTLKGSQKHLIGSFWAGVLSKYFSRELKCASFSYDEEEDRLLCVITV